MTGRLPNLFIIGATKCGTTSLFTYLNAHPDFCGSTIKEPTYFGPKKFETTKHDLESYKRFFANATNEKYVFEGSAIYVNTGRRLALFLKENFPGAKAIVMLRDPGERVFSQFKFSKDLLHLPVDMSFSDYIDRCLVQVKIDPDAENGLWGILANPYGDTVPDWMETFGDDLRIGFFEEMKADAAQFTDGICAWLGVPPASRQGVVFSIENPSMIPASRGLHAAARRLTEPLEPLLRRNPWLKRNLRGLYHRLNRARKPEPRPKPEDLARLRDYYEPSNARLREAFARHRPSQPLPAWLAADTANP